MLGDWLVVSQVLPVNPAAAVRAAGAVLRGGKPNATVVRSRSMRVPARADRHGASGKTGLRHQTGVITGLQVLWVNTTSLNTTYGVLRFQIKLE